MKGLGLWSLKPVSTIFQFSKDHYRKKVITLRRTKQSTIHLTTKVQSKYNNNRTNRKVNHNKGEHFRKKEVRP
jgi:vesicle coat complex subunit